MLIAIYGFLIIIIGEDIAILVVQASSDGSRLASPPLLRIRIGVDLVGALTRSAEKAGSGRGSVVVSRRMGRVSTGEVGTAARARARRAIWRRIVGRGGVSAHVGALDLVSRSKVLLV